MHQLAWWLTDQPGREADTEVRYARRRRTTLTG